VPVGFSAKLLEITAKAVDLMLVQLGGRGHRSAWSSPLLSQSLCVGLQLHSDLFLRRCCRRSVTDWVDAKFLSYANELRLPECRRARRTA
jgi:hypothetical protein